MSERLNVCPKCNAVQLKDNVLEVHNPDTEDMNMCVTLKCHACDHQWEGLTASNFYRKMRKRGLYR